MSKLKRIHFANLLLGSFVFVFALNLFFNADFWSVMSYMYWDITTLNLTFGWFAKIAGVLVWETSVISWIFYVITKKVF